MHIPDFIKKTVRLRAPIGRVWRAIGNSAEFGIWFGAEFHEPFEAGKRIQGCIRPTKVDPQVAKEQEAFDGHPFEVFVERVEPPHHLSFRWHPHSEDENTDASEQRTTLVTFELREVEDGTELVIIESGFHKIPIERRAKAFTSNEGGWDHQMRLIERYLSEHQR